MINVSKAPGGGHTTCPWLVIIPRRYSATGKRVYRRFATKSRATTFAEQTRQHLRTAGDGALIGSGVNPADASAAATLLEGTGLSLTAAVRTLLTLMPHAAARMSAPTVGGGAGEEPAATPKPEPPSLTVEQAISAHAKAKSHQAPITQENRATRLATLLSRNPGLADRALDTLTPADIEHALNTAWPNAPAAWNDGHKHLTAIYNFARRKRLISSDSPMPAIDPRHTAEAEIHPLTPDALRTLFAACRQPNAREREEARHAPTGYDRRLLLQDTSGLQPYIALCAFAGIRPTECTRLRWQDIDWEDSIISIRARNSKTGGTRHIELHPTLAAWLTAYRPAGALPTDLITPPTQLKWRLRALRTRAGYSPANPWQDDALRHTYATYYLKAGGDINRLQLNMGHANPRLLYTRYTNMAGTTRAMATAYWQITPPPAPPPTA